MHRFLQLDVIAQQRGHLFPWSSVFLAVGIGGYFALRFEPNVLHYGVLVLILLAIGAVGSRAGENFRPIWTALFLIIAGVVVAGIRAHSVAAPVLTYRYYGPIEGRIVFVDRSASDATRLTLDQVVLARTSPARTPERVRISMHGEQGFIEPEPGLRILTTGHLSPPSGPVEPGGFNFQRMAWFQKLGGVGYTRSPVLALEPAEKGRAGLFIHRLRKKISAYVQTQIEGERGAFAAAILTGDRSAMSQDTLADLRASNLAHLLAISGLHMGMLTGFVFAATRLLLALSPSLSMRLPTKKIAALSAILFGAGYLALSGGNVATVRAFIMVAVMFAAILLNRRALTLRAVAIAALIILLWRPESLTGPGFQMSFAATAALVAVFGALRDAPLPHVPRPFQVAGAVVLSSFIAGMATAPVSAFHFNQVSQYGLLANVLTVPLMGALVMPAAVISALLAPIGLAGLAFKVMALCIGWILGVAEVIASLEGAVRMVPTPAAYVLILMAIGGVFAIIWQGKWRVIGIPLILVSIGMWAVSERPTILVSDTGGLIGVLGSEGRALSKPRGEGFVAQSWLENDGDTATQEEAYARKGFEGEKGAQILRFGDQTMAHITGRNAALRAADACHSHDLVISPVKVEAGPCQLYDATTLRNTGSLAIEPQDNGFAVTSAQEAQGPRLWVPRRKPER
ncbi:MULTISPECIES: ComEC/Rec2 family competence protein [Halocynthiibacter]|uniref:ComEC family competence protein n=1 Tax=Halocynthiibacter halioticoli TaxID=2986804 RepID=A0AAE3LR30_9RHOB|nr:MULTISPECIES: ComEC/Rec2 family competence protein [Halocynthiibacter]MCV6824173.1 ComEC family competence protein [Halocynthiibacter halioticoli]MCW4057174.1 ComEC family competence protein [Halocynthiibacter sp. SDUM655004]